MTEHIFRGRVALTRWHDGDTVLCCRHCADQPRSHAVTGRNAHLLSCPEGCDP